MALFLLGYIINYLIQSDEILTVNTGTTGGTSAGVY